MRRAVLALLAAVLFLGACDRPPEVPVLDLPVPVTESDRVHLGGDVIATPLFRTLAGDFSARLPGPAIVVEEPLGAGGALRALEDAALDAVLSVGPLTPPGSPPPGTVVALTHVTLVTGRASLARVLDEEDLMRLLAGEAGGASPDHLRTATFLLGPVDDPAQSLVARASPRLAAAFDAAITLRRRPLYPDPALLRDALRRTPEAFAVSDTGTLRLLAAPLWPVRLSTAVPWDNRLAVRVVTSAHPRPRLQAFLAFLCSADGRALIADLGFTAAP